MLTDYTQSTAYSDRRTCVAAGGVLASADRRPWV